MLRLHHSGSSLSGRTLRTGMVDPSAPLTTIPARSGIAVRVARGMAIRVVNTHGTQVVDTWAFCADDLGEWRSMEHSRAHALTLRPSTGTTLYTNRRRPILHFLDDTSGSIHDTLIAACDRHRYALLGCSEDHANCTDNLDSSRSYGAQELDARVYLNF